MTRRQIREIVCGEDAQGHSTAKLKESQVREILRRYQECRGRRGIITELAHLFSVQKSTISDIVNRRSWRQLKV